MLQWTIIKLPEAEQRILDLQQASVTDLVSPYNDTDVSTQSPDPPSATSQTKNEDVKDKQLLHPRASVTDLGNPYKDTNVSTQSSEPPSATSQTLSEDVKDKKSPQTRASVTDLVNPYNDTDVSTQSSEPPSTTSQTMNDVKDKKLPHTRPSVTDLVSPYKDTGVSTQSSEQPLATSQTKKKDVKDKTSPNTRASMTDLVNPYKDTDVSTQSSEPPSATSQTLSKDIKDQIFPCNILPSIRARTLLKKSEMKENNGASVTELVNPYKDTDVSTQSSEPPSTTSQTLSEDVKDKRKTHTRESRSGLINFYKDTNVSTQSSEPPSSTSQTKNEDVKDKKLPHTRESRSGLINFYKDTDVSTHSSEPPSATSQTLSEDVKDNKLLHTRASMTDVVSTYKDTDVSTQSSEPPSATTQTLSEDVKDKQLLHTRASVTGLVNFHKDTNVSIQSSEPPSATSQTKNNDVKDKKKIPSIRPRNLLKKSEMGTIRKKQLEPKLCDQTIKTIEIDPKKPEGDVYLVSKDLLSNICKTTEAENTDDSDTIDPELQDMFKSSPKKLVSKLKIKREELENVTLNIAVTGMTGAGKSSLVNALRGLNNNDPLAASTGTTETTKEPEMYPYTSMPNVNIWDLPGIGSPKFKALTYLKDVGFNRYDFFLIVTSERFKENDIELAKAIRKKNKLFYFIRTKIDNDLRAEAKKRDFDQESLLNSIRMDCEKNLRKVGKPKVFLISSFNLEKYDFQGLVNTLEEELPENKRFALIQSLPVYSTEALTKKVTYFKKMIWLNALAAGFGAIVPIPGVSLVCDYGIIKRFFEQVFTVFCLSDESLKVLSERVNQPVDLLIAAKSSRFKNGVSEAIVINMMSEPIIAAAKTMGTIMALLPGGALPACGTAVASVHYLLNRGLNEMADDTRKVLTVAELSSD